MPNKKRRNAGPSGPQGRAQRQRQWDQQELQAEFELWISSPDAAGPASIIGTLLDLKAEQLDSPDPALWTEEVTVELLTEVVPRRVLQARQDAMDLVPAVRLFFEFLRDRGHWAAGSMSSEAASTLLAGLEFAVLEAVDDPSRRSFSTNILTYGLERGLDPEDEDALAAYMEWYNTLPHAHRVELSDSGRISDPAVFYDPSAVPPVPRGAHGSSFFAGDTDPSGPPAADDEELSWPWFLPDSGIDLEQIRDWEPQQHLPVYRRNALVRRAQILLDFVGQGRKLTATGALNRADTAAVLQRLGIDRTARSMWDVPELAQIWAVLHDGSWLETTGTRVRPGTGPTTPASAEEDPEQFVDFAHSLLLSALGSMWARDGAEGGFIGMPDTLTTLLYVCQDGGLRRYDLRREDIPEIPMDPRTGQQDVDELLRYMRVVTDLERLQTAGVLDSDEQRVYGSTPVLLAAIGLTEILGEMDELGETAELDELGETVELDERGEDDEP